MSNFKNFEDEIMVLNSIYEDRLEVTQSKYRNDSTTISMMLYPSTAEDISSQYVRLLLELTVDNINEDRPVEVKLKTSRGLSDDQLQNISIALNDHAQSNVGSSVLFDLIELAKDSLTSNNIPSSPCPICLANFQEYDDFLKTECYHYLHSYCLYQYVRHWKEEKKKEVIPSHLKHLSRTKESEQFLPCPVCREPIRYDLQALSKSTKPIETPLNDDFNVENIKQEVKKMESLYNLQKERGGIIDIEAEKKKYLLSSIEQAYQASSSSPSSSTDRLQPDETTDKDETEMSKSNDSDKNETSKEKITDTSSSPNQNLIKSHSTSTSSIEKRKSVEGKKEFEKTKNNKTNFSARQSRDPRSKNYDTTSEKNKFSNPSRHRRNFQSRNPNSAKKDVSNHDPRARPHSAQTGAFRSYPKNDRQKGNSDRTSSNNQHRPFTKVSEKRPAYYTKPISSDSGHKNERSLKPDTDKQK